ncbi:hypothetical protein CE91St43_15200 [Oscillospiraceae bacterium]|nr:hypothetical protein CE91St43_15200 [Oscillospiraceae bacterium]
MNTCSTSSGRRLTRNRNPLLLALCLAAACCLFLLSLCLGPSGVGPDQVLGWMLDRDIGTAAKNILAYARLPRAAAACLCGGALAVSGLLLQVALGNALAAPSTIGVNAGAGFFVILSGVLFPLSLSARTVSAFLGAFLSAMLVYGLARSTGGSRMTIVLAGVAITSLLSAASDALVTFRPEAVMDRSSFSIGGFGGVVIPSFRSVLPLLLLGLAGAVLLSGRLNVLLLGDEVAASLGLRVGLCRFLALLCAALLAACAVSIGGLLSFVGLLVPHALRFLLGNDYRWLTPFSAVVGAIFLLLCDTLSRLLFAPYELPVGILLSFLGAPFFLWLLLGRKRRLAL